MILTTPRLLLRPWRESDAGALYEYARDPLIGLPAGWPPHRNVDESRNIILTVFALEGIFAVTLRGSDKAIGCIGVTRGADSNMPIPDDEGEISYWIGVPFWGQGLIPEAMHAIIKYSFTQLKLKKLWCGYFDGNIKSKRVQEKCGFKHHHTNHGLYCPLTRDYRTEHVSVLMPDDQAMI